MNLLDVAAPYTLSDFVSDNIVWVLIILAIVIGVTIAVVIKLVNKKGKTKK